MGTRTRADGEVFTGRMDGLFVWGRTKAHRCCHVGDRERGSTCPTAGPTASSYLNTSLRRVVGHPVAGGPRHAVADHALTDSGGRVTHFDRSDEVRKILGRELQELGPPVHAPGDRHTERPISSSTGSRTSRRRVRRSWCSTIVRTSIRLVMGLVIAEDRSQRSWPRQERGVRRADRRASHEGLGRHPRRPRHRFRRAARRSDRCRRGRRTVDDRPGGTDPLGPAFFDPVLKGRWGAASIAAATGAPSIPIGLWGTEKVWPRKRPGCRSCRSTDRPLVGGHGRLRR